MYDVDSQILIDYSQLSPRMTAYHLNTGTFQHFTPSSSVPMRSEYDAKSGILFSASISSENRFTAPDIQNLDIHMLFQVFTNTE